VALEDGVSLVILAKASKRSLRPTLEVLEQSRAAAQIEAEGLRESAEASRGKISDWWNDVQRTWNEHVAQARTY
jgi:hypothetical protein